MPCNLYGPNDEFNTTKSHFLPALIKNFIIHQTKKLRYGDLVKQRER